MIDPRHLATLEDLVRELDMVVFDLELTPKDTVEALHDERRATRRRLERLRTQFEDLTRDLS